MDSRPTRSAPATSPEPTRVAAQKITNLPFVLDPWLDKEPEDAKRRAVLDKLIWIGENLPAVEALPALDLHPLKRTVAVPSAGVNLNLVLTRPFGGAHLLSIEAI